jgi:DNA-binding NarL/FixJ family response regulator
VLKDISPEELTQALLQVAQGKTHLHPEAASLLISHVQQDKGEDDNTIPGQAELTARELEVLVQIGLGLSNKEIASALAISHLTVKTHVSSILAKLQLADRTQAAIYAIRQGLIPEE